jgi:hypothetical protein
MGALVKMDLDGKSVTFSTDRNGARLQIDAFGGMLGLQMTLEQAEELCGGIGSSLSREARIRLSKALWYSAQG